MATTSSILSKPSGLLSSELFTEIIAKRDTLIQPYEIEYSALATVASVKPLNPFTLWHNRLGHVSNKVLKLMMSHLGLALEHRKKAWKEFTTSNLCLGCVKGKQPYHPKSRRPLRDVPFSSKNGKQLAQTDDLPKTLRPGQLYVLDVVYSNVEALRSRAKVALIIIDVSSKYAWTYPISNAAYHRNSFKITRLGKISF